MTVQALEGHLGAPLEIDICHPCQMFWFDQRESLQLSPRSTLTLFRLIGERAKSPTQAVSATSETCPRCQTPLARTKDRQRNTTFEYLRCPRGHGRLTTFLNFLREKDFIRPLSAVQIDELRRHVSTVNCSNCGASVDLGADTSCRHCGSPLSMLDLHQARALIGTLERAGRTEPIDPALPMTLARARDETNRAFDAFERDATWYRDASALGLVEAGLGALARWLK